MATTIDREYGIENKRDRYNLLKAAGKNLKDLAGQRIEVKAYLLVTAEDQESGEIHQNLKILTPDNEIIGTSSRSFIEGFVEFLDFMEDPKVESFEVQQKRSKNNRSYLAFIA